MLGDTNMCGPSPTEVLKEAEIPVSYKRDAPRLLLAEALEVAAKACPGGWHAVVIDDPEVLARLAESSGAKALGEAPYAVAVAAPKGSEGVAFRASVYVEIAARFLGLTPLWVAVTGVEKLLHLPEDLTCVAVVGMGKAAGARTPGFSSLKGRLHFNKYGGKPSSAILEALLKAKKLV